MTLDQVIQHLRKPPPVGAHEIVRSRDGLNHLVVIVNSNDVPTAGGLVREYAFHAWCNGITSETADILEVVDEAITCMLCIQWRTRS